MIEGIDDARPPEKIILGLDEWTLEKFGNPNEFAKEAPHKIGQNFGKPKEIKIHRYCRLER